MENNSSVQTENERRNRAGQLAGSVGIGVNILLAALKIVLGILSASVSIMADGFNNLSDAGSSLVTLVSFRIAAKPADRDHPFGHARIEYIASMVVSFLILLVGGELFISSAKAIFHQGETAALVITPVTLVALGISIVGKLGLGFFYQTIGKQADSQVLRASAADSFSDCLSTGAVLISSIVIKLTGFALLDAIVGIAVSILILVAGLKIFRETMDELIGIAPADDTIKAIEKIIEKYPDA